MRRISHDIFEILCGPTSNVCSGLFAWDILEDRLHGDALVAARFGIDATALASGIPLLTYLGRIHSEDKGEAAHGLRDAIVTGQPQHQRFRVKGMDGSYETVLMSGQCFPDKDGVARVYAGIMYNACDEPTAPLERLCANALDVARQTGNELVGRYLEQALKLLAKPN
ncbi:hypothetical protein QTL95_21550 [Rhizobium sp. S152]|uniref:hypothetical protein n=1 Tax=Rhizobium sp. S152 TaxID=3055038 RepID=UPI0025AA2FE0|nr:hypothetical protein [Rhizobium sp. S152]MDM9628486.1 hypothetical protein [Rhizobium sp. S152]